MSPTPTPLAMGTCRDEEWPKMSTSPEPVLETNNISWSTSSRILEWCRNCQEAKPFLDMDIRSPSSVSGARRDYGSKDIRVGWSIKTMLDCREGTGVCLRADTLGELGRGDREVERDRGMETIRERCTKSRTIVITGVHQPVP